MVSRTAYAQDRLRVRYDNKVRRQTECSLAYYVEHPHEVDDRLRELDDEWDTERLLDLNGSLAALGGLAISMFRGSKWIMFSAAMLGFGLQRTLTPTKAPLRLLRRLGIRTRQEIQEERLALMALRGDLQDVMPLPGMSSGDAAQYLLRRVRMLIEEPEVEEDEAEDGAQELEMRSDEETMAETVAVEHQSPREEVPTETVTPEGSSTDKTERS